jgi:hypothetical protein
LRADRAWAVVWAEASRAVHHFVCWRERLQVGSSGAGGAFERCGHVFEGRAKRFGKIGDDFAIRAWEIVDVAPRVEFAATVS